MANINDLQERIRNFAEARDWERFHIPKNLCLALSAEIGELAAEFLWLSDSESMSISEEKKETCQYGDCRCGHLSFASSRYSKDRREQVRY